MNQSVNNIFKHIAGNRSLEETPLEKLKILAEGYPYFPIAQLFLAKKLKDEYSNSYTSQSQKSVLYFSNPFWFDYLMNVENVTGADEEEAKVAGLENIEKIQSTVAATETEEQYKLEPETKETLAEKPDAVEESPQTISETATVVENENVENISTDELETAIKIETISPIANKEIATESESIAEKVPNETEAVDEHEKMFRSIKAMLDASFEEADADVNNTDIPIDPYYTIDYFASQGIKLDLDNPNDKLGQNLKRFTQWLRHMKKLGPEDAGREIENTQADEEEQKMADTSNKMREVVTEAMASFLEKQGKKGKAIELYTKLSFLNPDKSVYFAAQIQKLKDF